MTTPVGKRINQYPRANSLADSDLLIAEVHQEPGQTPILNSVDMSLFRTTVLGATGLGSQNAANANTVNLTGNLILTDLDFMFQVLDPGGADRTVTLPAASVATNHSFMIHNNADNDETLTVYDANAAIVGVVSRGQTASFMPSGTTWFGARGQFRDLWIGGWRPLLTNGCTDSAQIEMATNKNVYDYPAFNKDTIQYAYANVPLPKDYSGGAIYATFYWLHPATTINFGVVWGLQGVCFGDAVTLDAACGTPKYVTDTGGNASYSYISALSAAITLAGTPAARKLTHWQVLRKATDAADTLAVDAYLIGVMIWYPVR